MTAVGPAGRFVTIGRPIRSGGLRFSGPRNSNPTRPVPGRVLDKGQGGCYDA